MWPWSASGWLEGIGAEHSEFLEEEAWDRACELLMQQLETREQEELQRESV